MVFEWDAAKSLANVRKHGVSFEEAATVFQDPTAWTFPDPDHSEKEHREITVGHTIKERLVFVSHCDRQGGIRLISARLATKKERRVYEEGIDR